MTPGLPRVVVAGGGIAGLSAAWECHRRGLAVTVLEAQNRAGGVIRTDVVDPFVLDTGPDAFLASKPGALALCRELGIDGQLISQKSPRGAFVLRDGRLHALPEGGAFGIPTRAGPFLRSTLLSPAGKLRVALEPLVPRRTTPSDESAGAFFRRRFGVEAARYIAQPLLGGIHAGDLERLSADAVLPQLVAVERRGGSVLRALHAQSRRRADDGPFRSFPTGMATLVAALQAQLPPAAMRLGSPVLRIVPEGRRWVAHTAQGDHVEADVLLLALPAWAVADLLRPLRPDLAALAQRISYVSSAGVLAVYRDVDVTRPLRGSGYVSTPGADREPLLATSWLSGKWEGRAPAGYTVLRGFFGGAFDEAALERADDELVDEAHRSWSRRFGVTGVPVVTRVVRWIRASPQHEVGHAERVSRLDAGLADLPTVAVAGSGFRAIGIPDVIADARSAMASLLDGRRAR